jgi:hypothetical protein
MSFKFVVFVNLIIVFLNFYFLWKLIQFNNYLFNLNNLLSQINSNANLILKEIPLTILLTGLEIKKFRTDFINFKTKIKNIQKIIIITKFIYRIVCTKLI